MSATPPTLPRHAQVTPINQGPRVNIASWTLMCTTVLFTGFRLLSNVVLRGHVAKDDWIICFTTLLAISQTIATSFMVNNGIGQHQDALSAGMIMGYERAVLAASILYVTTLAFSKFSLLFFLSRVISAPQQTFRRLMQATWAILALYLISEVFVLAFQCNLPHTYDYINGRCIKLLAFWDFDCIFDVASSLLILALPIVIVQPLQMPAGRKFQAVSAFAFQVPACVFAIVRLVYLHRALNAQDRTWAAVDWQIWSAINMHFNVVAANIPCLKIFLDGFQSTLFRHDLATQVGSGSLGHHSADRSGQQMSNPHHDGSNRSLGSRNRSTGSKDRQGAPNTATDTFRLTPDGKLRPYDGETTAAIGSHPSIPENDSPPFGIAENHIQKTTEWSVLKSEIDPDKQS